MMYCIVLYCTVHSAGGGKAVERDRKTAEAGRGVRQPGEDDQIKNPMTTVLQYSYANLSLLFAHYHSKIIPWGHKTADFAVLGFGNQESDED
jgi:hypothetical protein